MRSEVPGYAESGWPFTHAQARAIGVSPATIARRVSVGTWVRLHAGVYVVAGTAHPLQAPAAALLAAGRHAVLSHGSAAQLLGVELWDPPDRPALTLPLLAGRPTLTGVRVYRGDLVDAERTQVSTTGPPAVRWPVTEIGRTLSDLALQGPVLPAVVAADSALRAALLDLASLRWLADQRQGRPGATRLRQLVELVDPAAESVLESVLRTLICLAGLPRPRSQHWVRASGRRMARVDLAYVDERIALEADGRMHDEPGQFEADRQRQNALVNAGWRVLRFTHHDLRFRPEQVVAEIAAAVATG